MRLLYRVNGRLLHLQRAYPPDLVPSDAGLRAVIDVSLRLCQNNPPAPEPGARGLSATPPCALRACAYALRPDALGSKLRG